MSDEEWRRRIEQFRSESGSMLLVDKEPLWSSFDVIKKIRLGLSVRKVGHAGTLDPRATGLLILCSNKTTRRISVYQDMEKEYIGVLTLGATTSSFDAATKIVSTSPVGHLSEEEIREHAGRFTGTVQQIPPMYSAIKVNGERLYKLARKGKTVERAARSVTIFRFDIRKIRLPEVWFSVRCGKGTYIRSLVHDLGASLGTGAYVRELRRTSIGPYSVDDAGTVDTIIRHSGMHLVA